MSDAELKREAAVVAAELVQDGMVVGLGTGSTAAFVIEALGRRVRAGLTITAIPTSERTAALAREAGIALGGFADHRRLDLTLDGADEIALGSLDLVKGLGGALLREKIVAAASDRFVVVADGGKLVERLGQHVPVPVEVVPFGWEVTADRLRAAGTRPARRLRDDETPYLTDGGHFILDCGIDPVADAAELDHRLRAIVGVVETGLFLGMASAAVVAGPEGVRTLTRGDDGPGATAFAA